MTDNTWEIELLYNLDAMKQLAKKLAALPENQLTDGSGGVNWDYVSADMHMSCEPSDPKSFGQALDLVFEELSKAA